MRSLYISFLSLFCSYSEYSVRDGISPICETRWEEITSGHPARTNGQWSWRLSRDRVAPLLHRSSFMNIRFSLSFLIRLIGDPDSFFFSFSPFFWRNHTTVTQYCNCRYNGGIIESLVEWQSHLLYVSDFNKSLINHTHSPWSFILSSCLLSPVFFKFNFVCERMPHSSNATGQQRKECKLVVTSTRQICIVARLQKACYQYGCFMRKLRSN